MLKLRANRGIYGTSQVKLPPSLKDNLQLKYLQTFLFFTFTLLLLRGYQNNRSCVKTNNLLVVHDVEPSQDALVTLTGYKAIDKLCKETAFGNFPPCTDTLIQTARNLFISASQPNALSDAT